MQQIPVSGDFRKMTARAIASIALFIFTYILLACLSIALVGLCGFLGLMILSVKVNFLTVMLAIGLVSMGLLILIFLVKFIFKKHVTDLTHLTEITRQQEPTLFLLIEDIVREVQTDFPKKVYISADVNASVFYNSSFWSMFLPVKKNLHIGIGLVNTVSVTEFKAILAHEFGHFSQRTMKVGSYVYNVNQVIYNMLYDNDSYDAVAQKWAGLSGYLTFFVALAVKIVQGVQWILGKNYEILNLSYMRLSREMEFHADEVAANVAGSGPLISSLLRMELADHAYNEVLNYYNAKVGEAVKSKNIYPEQTYVMNFIAGKSKLPFYNNLPQVTPDHLSRYNKSKLVITNQWASHPSTEDRVRHLERLNMEMRDHDPNLAASLFSDIEILQRQLTDKLFSSIQYETPDQVKINDRFADEFLENYKGNSFDDLYNSFYDTKSPVQIHADDIATEQFAVSGPEDLFTSEAVDDVYTSVAMDNDINTLRNIADGSYPVKRFDYDGVKYTAGDCRDLIATLETNLSAIKEVIARHDIRIYRYFHGQAVKHGKEKEMNLVYETFTHIDLGFDGLFKVYVSVANASNFIFHTTPFEVIRLNLKSLNEAEMEFKKAIGSMLTEGHFQDNITGEMQKTFSNYLSNQYVYFYDQAYNSDEIDILFTCINNYQQVLSKTYFNAKKRLLDFQVELVG